MTLGQKQELFSELEAKWVLWVLGRPGLALRHGEARILPKGPNGKGRKARDLATGRIVRVRDLVHKSNGNHYNGLAADWNLFIDGEWISDGSHEVWKRIGLKWESMHPLCRWGGRFGDANHISLEHNGVK